MRRIRLFNLDLHISVVQDVKNILRTLYGDRVELVHWSISGHNWVFGTATPDVRVVNAATWRGFSPAMVAAFQAEYGSFLAGFDGFLVTHTPAFALLYEPYDKPVLVVNSCRYEQPFGFTRDRAGWEWLNAGLQRMSAKGQLALVSNNKADAEYLVRGTGLRSTVIPSLCLYTCASHTPVHSSIVVYGDRGFFPPCARLVERPASGYSWSTLYSYAAIVHVPYEMSTMSLFEQYSAGVPLFLPSRAFYSTCIRDGSLRLGSIYGAAADAPPALAEALTSADFWLSRADYYDTDNFRGVYFYESREDLVRQVSTFEESATVKAERLAWIASRAERVLDAWRALMFRWWFGRVKMEDL